MAFLKAALPLILAAAAASANSAFEAHESIDVAGIYDAVKEGVARGQDVLATYATDYGLPATVTVNGDWKSSSTHYYYFMADMDIDCDGVDVSLR